MLAAVVTAYLAWAAQWIEPPDPREVQCLAETIYHEARGEPVLGQMRVVEVVLNRRDHHRWPNTVCDVVYQPHQFEWVSNSPEVREIEAFRLSVEMATFYLTGIIDRRFPKALFFLNESVVQPRWLEGVHKVAVVGNHSFYTTR